MKTMDYITHMIMCVALSFIMLLLCTSFAYAKDEFEMTYIDYPKTNEFEEIRTRDISEHKNINLAVGASLKIKFYCGDEDHEWKINDTNVITVKSTKFTSNYEDVIVIKGKHVGKTKLQIIRREYFYNSDDEEEEIRETISYIYITVTNPVVADSNKNLLLVGDSSVRVSLKGTTTSSKKAYSPDSGIVGLYDNIFYSTGKSGKGSFYIYIDGTRIKCFARVYSDPYFIIKNNKMSLCKSSTCQFWCGDVRKQPRYCMYIMKGKKATVKLKGVPKKAKYAFVSTKPDVIKVNSNGVMKARKKGDSIIKVKVCGATIKAKIYIVSKKQLKTLKTAFKMAKKIEKVKINYSMKYRMKPNYADCSSLVWKIMKTGSCKFGSNAAPGAGGEYRWCKAKHLVLKTKKASKTIPCDVVFFQFDGYECGHVEMAIGYDCCIGIGTSGTGMIEIIGTAMKISHIARPIK